MTSAVQERTAEVLSSVARRHQQVARHVAHVVGAGQRKTDGEFLADDVERERNARFAAVRRARREMLCR